MRVKPGLRFETELYEERTMAILTVTARGQVTLEKDVLQYLGIKPGDK